MTQTYASLLLAIVRSSRCSRRSRRSRHLCVVGSSSFLVHRGFSELFMLCYCDGNKYFRSYAGRRGPFGVDGTVTVRTTRISIIRNWKISWWWHVVNARVWFLLEHQPSPPLRENRGPCISAELFTETVFVISLLGIANDRLPLSINASIHNSIECV